MRHDFFDKYGYLDSPVHRVPAVLKLILALCFILWIVTLDEFLIGYGIALAILLILILLSRVPINYIFIRSMVIVPFLALVLIFMAFFQKSGAEKIIFVSLRAWLSITALIWLTSTTPFPELLRAMRRLKMPALILTLLGFIYRYFFLLTDEAQRMQSAVRMRTWGRTYSLGLKVYSQLIGMLFIRSYERSERVYQAMVMRGFKSEGAGGGEDK